MVSVKSSHIPEEASLPKPYLVQASQAEKYHSKMRIIKNVAPLAALCQLAFGVWYSFYYGSTGHISGLLWLFLLFIAVLPDLAKTDRMRILAKKFESDSDAGNIRALALGVIWACFPLLMSHIGNETEMLAVFAGYLVVVAITSIYHFTIPTRGICFLTPAVLGVAGLASTDWLFFHQLPLAAFFVTAFTLSIGLGYLFTSKIAQHTQSTIAIGKRDDVIGLLLAEGDSEGHSQWLLQTDKSGIIQNSHDNLAEVFGGQDLQFKNLRLTEALSQLAKDNAYVAELSDILDRREIFIGYEIPLKISGNTVHWSISVLPIEHANNDFTGHVVLISDKTLEKNAEEERSKLALSDPLTGLINRARFSEEIELETAKLERYGTNFTLMFLDLDKFKLVNDLRGHLVGDKLLKLVGQRILSVVRETDSVARLGGDEFAILMRDECDAGAAARLAARLLQVVGRKYEIDGEFHSIGVSIGIALAPLNGTRPNQLLRNADLALYRSKEDGRGVFRFFESQMDADQREKRMLELELREAIEHSQFELFYQPLISTETGNATGMEALIRWNHPIRGRISPDEFMPIAEQTALIQEIGHWTIREACSTAMTWPEDMCVSINLSAQHLIGSDIVKITRAALEESGLAPDRLELEITESLFINNADEAADLLNSLKALGVDIVLDDFGTGYSSLAYILKFPFDKIKIDRSFVMASSGDSAARTILKMISNLGEELGIRITAEGVETSEQVEFLRSIKCDEFQGFFFAKPLSRNDLSDFISRQNSCESTHEQAEDIRIKA